MSLDNSAAASMIELLVMGPDDEATRFELFAEVRAEELGMADWDPLQRLPLMRIQFAAQRQGYRDQFPSADARLILNDGVPAGWVIVDRSGPRMHCVDVAIRRDARGKGLGTDVLRALQQEAASEERPLALAVQRMNTRAHALYTRLGFREVRVDDTHVHMEWRPCSTA